MCIRDRHWDQCLAMGEFDYVTDFAAKLPMDVVSELLDVPEADRAYLREQSDLLIHREEGVLDIPEAAVSAGCPGRAAMTSASGRRAITGACTTSRQCRARTEAYSSRDSPATQV